MTTNECITSNLLVAVIVVVTTAVVLPLVFVVVLCPCCWHKMEIDTQPEGEWHFTSVGEAKAYCIHRCHAHAHAHAHAYAFLLLPQHPCLSCPL